jgi:hypothetical protein
MAFILGALDNTVAVKGYKKRERKKELYLRVPQERWHKRLC